VLREPAFMADSSRLEFPDCCSQRVQARDSQEWVAVPAGNPKAANIYPASEAQPMLAIP
jgi:hypothetical protein